LNPVCFLPIVGIFVGFEPSPIRCPMSGEIPFTSLLGE
jgi:hypothetical protein